MIKRLTESHGPAFGFAVTEQLTVEDIAQITPQIDAAIAAHKHPIGLLANLSAMQSATWSARWEEMRFLQRHSDHIARLAVVCDETWEEIAEMAAVATAALQAETRYFHTSEILHAWHWVKLANHDEGMPVRILYRGKGLFQDYTPEYMGI